MRGAQPESIGGDAAASAVRPRAFAPDLSHIAVGVAAAVGVGALGAADGGYFPPAWGWTALVSLWLVIAWLLLGRAALHGGRLAAVFFGGLTGLAAWTWLSLAWTDNTTQTVLEGFRMLAYAGVAAAFVLVVRRETAPALLRGVLAGLVLISAYGLLTRLLPERIGSFDTVSGYRLSEPLGYWNGFAVFVTLGLLLALGAVARERNVALRAVAGASFVVLLPALYFTFSRGAWIALVVGLAAAVALDPRRLQLIVALFVVGIPALIATAIGSSYEGLIRRDSPLSVVTEQGGELVIVIALFALVAAAATVALSVAERRYEPPRNVRLAFAAMVAVVTLVALAAVVVRFGGPVDMVDRAYDAFKQPPSGSDTDLGDRLFTLHRQLPGASSGRRPGTSGRTTPSSARERARTSSTGTSTDRSSTRFATPTTSIWRRWASLARSGSLCCSWRWRSRSPPRSAPAAIRSRPERSAPTSPTSSTRRSTGIGNCPR